MVYTLGPTSIYRRGRRLGVQCSESLAQWKYRITSEVLMPAQSIHSYAPINRRHVFVINKSPITYLYPLCTVNPTYQIKEGVYTVHGICTS